MGDRGLGVARSVYAKKASPNPSKFGGKELEKLVKTKPHDHLNERNQHKRHCAVTVRADENGVNESGDADNCGADGGSGKPRR